VIKQSDNNLKEKLVALTRDLMLVPTTRSRPNEIARGFQLIKNQLGGLRKVKLHDYKDQGVLSLLALPTGIQKPDILLCAHIDVVDYPSLSAFNSKIRQGKIYGPGAGDMKGALAVSLEIFRHFHSKHAGISLGLLITSDEEAGGASGTGYLFNKENLRCGLALVPDGGSLTHVTTHEKGVLHLKVTCRGHFSHASRPWEGKNALLRLMKNFSRLNQLFDELKEGNQSWHPTCAPTMVRTSNEVANRIPDHAEGTLDIRFPAPYSSREMLKKIKACLDDDLEFEILIEAEPSELKPDPLYLKITEEVARKKVDTVRDHGGSDARFIAAKGIPVIISRPLVGNLHSEEEWIDIDSMVTFYQIYEAYIHEKLNSNKR